MDQHELNLGDRWVRRTGLPYLRPGCRSVMLADESGLVIERWDENVPTRRMSITYDKLRKGDVVVTPERVVVWIDRPDPTVASD